MPIKASAPGTALWRDPTIWWLAIPPLLYAFFTHDIVRTLLLAIVGAALKYAQTRKELPPVARPYLHFLQPVVVLFFLGGNPIIIIVVLAAIGAAIWKRDRMITALEPWWRIQQRIPLVARRILAAVIALVAGYLVGLNASGSEWTYTFLSIAFATVVAFLLMFTPPDSMRRRRPGGAT